MTATHLKCPKSLDVQRLLQDEGSHDGREGAGRLVPNRKHRSPTLIARTSSFPAQTPSEWPTKPFRPQCQRRCQLSGLQGLHVLTLNDGDGHQLPLAKYASWLLKKRSKRPRVSRTRARPGVQMLHPIRCHLIEAPCGAAALAILCRTHPAIFLQLTQRAVQEPRISARYLFVLMQLLHQLIPVAGLL